MDSVEAKVLPWDWSGLAAVALKQAFITPTIIHKPAESNEQFFKKIISLLVDFYISCNSPVNGSVGKFGKYYCQKEARANHQ
jgi:hypothetical protein